MSDINSSLPVRTENNGDVAVKLVDGLVTSQTLSIDANGLVGAKISDAAGNGITSQANGSQQALDIGINVAGVQIDPRQMRALTSSDVVTANQGSAAALSGAWPVKITDGTNSLAISGSGELSVSITQPLPTGTNTLGSINILSGGTAITNTGGALDVHIASGSISIGSADKSAFTYGTSNFQAIGGVYQDSSPSLTAGQSGAARLTADRALHSNLRDSSGNELLGQKVMAASIPVAISSDQSALDVKLQDGSGNALSSTSGALNVAISQSLPAGSNLIGSVDANLKVSNAAVTVANPVPVTVVSATPGTAVQDYHTSAAVAAGSSVNLDYTVPVGQTFSLARLWAASTGKLKVVLQVESGVASGSFSNLLVGFNSTANPNVDMTVVSQRTVATGIRVRAVITNKENQAQDLYCTFEGTLN